ncbi:MAG: hypothetical protein HY925_05595 [Elusimicrobia bacterium]|nr:hypothetical protein [Elusimicrobiota bacterium]
MGSLSSAIALPLSLISLQAPADFPVPVEVDAPPPVGGVAQVYHLATLDNDNDGIRFVLSARTDANGRLTQLLNFNANDSSDGRIYNVGPAMSRCPATGADRLDRRRGCGIEMEHARGDISAIRLFTPNFNPETGGRVVLFYLKRYAIFGSHEVGVVELRIAKLGDDWALVTDYAGRQRRVLGLFVHRLSRGVALTTCLDGSCPNEWPRRARESNDGLPPVWGIMRRLATLSYAN